MSLLLQVFQSRMSLTDRHNQTANVLTASPCPDGLTMVPWKEGKLLTVVCPVADSYVDASARVAGRFGNGNGGSTQGWQIFRLAEDSLFPAYHCWIPRPNEHNGILVLGRAGTKDFSRFRRRSWEQLSVPTDFCFNTALQLYLVARELYGGEPPGSMAIRVLTFISDWLVFWFPEEHLLRAKKQKKKINKTFTKIQSIINNNTVKIYCNKYRNQSVSELLDYSNKKSKHRHDN